MFQRKPRRFSRRQSNGRNYHHSHEKNSDNRGLRSNSFPNLHSRNNFQSQKSAEKLVEKYNGLAKEALTSGDRVLSESFFQYADWDIFTIGIGLNSDIGSRLIGGSIDKILTK